jgi:6-phosphogluconolactonase/glucosamine-6-phosphate isomerase/deaminase
MGRYGMSGALVAGATAFLFSVTPAISSDQLRANVQKQVVKMGVSPQEAEKLTPAALAQAELILNEAEGSSKADQIRALLARQ